MADTFYEVLGIPHGAAQSKVKEAYRRQAQRWHPDLNQGSRESVERFRRIAEAYSVLRDVQSRSAYDRALAEGSNFPEQRIDPDAAAAIFFQEILKRASELGMKVPSCMGRNGLLPKPSL